MLLIFFFCSIVSATCSPHLSRVTYRRNIASSDSNNVWQSFFHYNYSVDIHVSKQYVQSQLLVGLDPRTSSESVRLSLPADIAAYLPEYSATTVSAYVTMQTMASSVPLIWNVRSTDTLVYFPIANYGRIQYCSKRLYFWNQEYNAQLDRCTLAPDAELQTCAQLKQSMAAGACWYAVASPASDTVYHVNVVPYSPFVYISRNLANASTINLGWISLSPHKDMFDFHRGGRMHRIKVSDELADNHIRFGLDSDLVTYYADYDYSEFFIAKQIDTAHETLELHMVVLTIGLILYIIAWSWKYAPPIIRIIIETLLFFLTFVVHRWPIYFNGNTAVSQTQARAFVAVAMCLCAVALVFRVFLTLFCLDAQYNPILTATAPLLVLLATATLEFYNDTEMWAFGGFLIAQIFMVLVLASAYYEIKRRSLVVSVLVVLLAVFYIVYNALSFTYCFLLQMFGEFSSVFALSNTIAQILIIFIALTIVFIATNRKEV